MPSRWPDLAVLELLVAITTHGGLGGAARAVGMAQPNASRAITGLERSLGLTLVERRSRGSRLTADGVVIAELAQRPLDDASALLAMGEALRGTHDAEIDVAASLTVAEYLLPAWIARLRDSHPDLDVRLRVENSARVFDLLEAREIDLGFVESPTVRHGMHSRTVATDRLVVVAAPGHPWAALAELAVDDLVATPLIARERGSGTRSTLARALGGRELADPALELGSNTAVLVSAASGAGPTVISEYAAHLWIARGDLVEIPLAGHTLRRRLRAVWRRGERMSEPVAALLLELGDRRSAE